MATPPAMHRVASLADLSARDRLVVRVGARQIVLFRTARGLHACNNRCPHEGYPLAEGSLTEECVLTCNWHNWKFDLRSGATLVGGDSLRSYPVAVRDGEVYLEITEPDPEERARELFAALEEAFREHDYSRIARELARLRQTGVPETRAFTRALLWAHDRLEFGSTHAHAAAADWLRLADSMKPDDSAASLVPYLEAIGHLAWDSLRHPVYPYTTRSMPFDPLAFADAVEREDEDTATALVRGAIAAQESPWERSPDGFALLWSSLARAALAHYNDFGHSVIYVYKASQLLETIESEHPPEPAVREAILLPLVRSILYASREDLVPEFRAYPTALADWHAPKPADLTTDGVADEAGDGPVSGFDGDPRFRDAPIPDRARLRHPRAEHFIGASVREALARCVAARHAQGDSFDPLSLYDALFGAAAWNLLHFDTDWESRADQSVTHNVGWLDFTHALTFANAVRALASRDASLWPAGLLQMACFVGRVKRYVLPTAPRETGAAPAPEWAVADPARFFAEQSANLLDHGVAEYIVSAHLLKTFSAVREEFESRPGAPGISVALAATNRFLHGRIKRRHSLRTARQALDFVHRE